MIFTLFYIIIIREEGTTTTNIIVIALITIKKYTQIFCVVVGVVVRVYSKFKLMRYLQTTT